MLDVTKETGSDEISGRLLKSAARELSRPVFKYFFNFLTKNNLITSVQSGFMSGNSTINRILHIKDFFGKMVYELFVKFETKSCYFRSIFGYTGI